MNVCAHNKASELGWHFKQLYADLRTEFCVDVGICMAVLTISNVKTILSFIGTMNK